METIFAITLALMFFIFTSKYLKNTNENKPTKDKNQKASELNLLFDRAKKEFLEYEVIKKEGKVVIRELMKLQKNPRELVYIRITYESKVVRESTDQQHLIARYPHVPSKEEMRSDFLKFLNKF